MKNDKYKIEWEMISDLPCVIHNYTFFKLIGKGGFSSVYLVRSNRFDFLYCAKVTQIQNPEAKDDEMKTIDNEIKALTLLNHPNIEKMSEYVLSLIHIIKKEMIDKEESKNSTFNIESVSISDPSAAGFVLSLNSFSLIIPPS